MTSSLKKTKVKLDLLTDIDMLLIDMKNHHKNKKSSYLKLWYVCNLYGWAMSQKLPLGGFKWVQKTSQFNGYFTKSYNGGK